MRAINTTFIYDLTSGKLLPFLDAVRRNPDQLSLEIRKNYVNIYYRGGSLLKIIQHSHKGYEFSFDAKYCINKAEDSSFEEIRAYDPYSAETFAENLPRLMNEMDTWFSEHPKPERDFQHTLLVSNPDIIDIEYQVGKRMRLDMLAFHDGKIIVIENKYGNGAISGSAGLSKHYTDMCSVIEDRNLFSELSESVVTISAAKYALGLKESIVRESDIIGTEIMFLLAGYNEKSKAAGNELDKMVPTVPAKILMMEKTESRIRWNNAKDLFSTQM